MDGWIISVPTDTDYIAMQYVPNCTAIVPALLLEINIYSPKYLGDESSNVLKYFSDETSTESGRLKIVVFKMALCFMAKCVSYY